MGVNQYITHFGTIRMRVVGSGTLYATLYSLDDTRSQVLTNTTLAATTDRQPTRLANFKSMGARLELKVDSLGDWFKCDGIIIYVKPSETSYPQ